VVDYRHRQRTRDKVRVGRKSTAARKIRSRSNPERDPEGSPRDQSPMQIGGRSQRALPERFKSRCKPEGETQRQPKEPRRRRKPNPEARRHRQRSCNPAQAGEWIQGTPKEQCEGLKPDQSSEGSRKDSREGASPIKTPRAPAKGIEHRRKLEGDPEAPPKTQPLCSRRADAESR
jgi:hypothetical protein